LGQGFKQSGFAGTGPADQSKPHGISPIIIPGMAPAHIAGDLGIWLLLSLIAWQGNPKPCHFPFDITACFQ
jgi:hypothetical protein